MSDWWSDLSKASPVGLLRVWLGFLISIVPWAKPHFPPTSSHLSATSSSPPPPFLLPSIPPSFILSTPFIPSLQFSPSPWSLLELSLPSGCGHLKKKEEGWPQPSIISFKEIPSFPHSTLLSLPLASFAFCPSWASLLGIRRRPTSGAFHGTQRVTASADNACMHMCTLCLHARFLLAILTLPAWSEVTGDWHESRRLAGKVSQALVCKCACAWWTCWCWNAPVARLNSSAGVPGQMIRYAFMQGW